MKMEEYAAQNEQPSILHGALHTAEPQTKEKPQKPRSSNMSPMAADSTASEEGNAKSGVTILLENRARVD